MLKTIPEEPPALPSPLEITEDERIPRHTNVALRAAATRQPKEPPTLPSPLEVTEDERIPRYRPSFI